MKGAISALSAVNFCTQCGQFPHLPHLGALSAVKMANGRHIKPTLLGNVIGLELGEFG